MIIYSYGETAYNKKVAHTLCVNFHVFQSPERVGGAWVCHQPGGGLGDKPCVPSETSQGRVKDVGQALRQVICSEH